MRKNAIQKAIYRHWPPVSIYELKKYLSEHIVIFLINFIVFFSLTGTDDGDLKFNYLSNFGSRFKKLANMYGEESPSDEKSD